MTRILAWSVPLTLALAMAITFFLGRPAASQDIRPRITLVEPGGPGCFADIVIVDIAGIYNQDVALETSLGTVVVRYQTRTDHADPDFAEVMVLPQNVVAHPPALDLTPDRASVICLIEWQGV